ncbi:hypothetical protein EDB19DRAFT_831665 [Suillus lakei]|nr:hypothetical protein EDB19DRAFT_831665 [Suillus lakei]
MDYHLRFLFACDHNGVGNKSSSTTEVRTLTSVSGSGFITTAVLSTVTMTTLTSTSSSSATQNNTLGSTSTGSQGLSTPTQIIIIELVIGILFFLILSGMLVCYLRRRSRRAREKASDGPALLLSEVSQGRPPALGASPERELLAPPSPRLSSTYPNSLDISRSPHHPTTSFIAPLLHPVSAWNRHGTLSQATDTQPATTRDVPTLTNLHDPFSATARSASNAFTMASMATSPPHVNPYDDSVLTSAPFGGSESNSQELRPEPPLSPLHTDLVQHQKQLELEHGRRLEAPEDLHDPPPEYSSF